MPLKKLAAWFALSRPPFHTVGVLPYVLGSVLAWRQSGTFRWDVCLWGTAGVILIMLATYYAGEYWDHVEDALGAATPSRFAGGSGVIQRGLLPRRAALWGSIVSLVLAAVVVLVLQFTYRTGPWTLPLALMGALGGFFYSTRPIRWVSSGVGELWITVCYGWLPVAAGYYLQLGRLAPTVHVLAVPIGLTIFNVILLNEFPDYEADRAAHKTNLVVRVGRTWGARLYGAIAVASWAATLFSLAYGVPNRALWVYAPTWILSLACVVQVARGRWRDRGALERLCAANILVNLGTTAAYILAFVR